MSASLSEKLEQLIETSSFEDLSIQQQQAVLKESSQEEYELYHALISQAKSLTPSSALPSSSLAEIKASLGTQLSPDQSLIQKTLGVKIPVWTAVALAFASWGSLLFFRSISPVAEQALAPKVITLTDTIYLQKTDTLYLERVSEPKVIIKEVVRMVAVDVEDQPSDNSKQNKVNLEAPSQEQHPFYYAKLETQDLLAGKQGRSVSEEDELMELLDLK